MTGASSLRSSAGTPESWVDIRIEDTRWAKLPFAKWVDRAAEAVCAYLGLAVAQIELSVLACDDATIAPLNAEFRGKSLPTNVLSWPAVDLSANVDGGHPHTPTKGLDDTYELGDIAISFDTCETEARAAGKPIEDHVTHLIVHGVLHLLGYDHISEADAALMEGIEVEILGKLGLDNPYLS